MAQLYFYKINFQDNTFTEEIYYATETAKQYRNDQKANNLSYFPGDYRQTYLKSELPSLGKLWGNSWFYITDFRKSESEMRGIFLENLNIRRRKIADELQELDKKISIVERLPMMAYTEGVE